MPRLVAPECVLAVHDLATSVRFYVDVLGFRVDFAIDGWSFLSRDGVRLRLGECPDALAPADLGDHSYFVYLRVEGIDALYAAFAARGVEVISAPVDEPWGMREFAIRTIDGHRIRLGEALPQ